ncbi:hypothetical protein SAMN05443287_109238 [Micromonospora phaseoli]|uniref:Uncharacterized protein n=1 Tax=Micromonospora phaseoli TaxID=1144548 RepID=A0A1H7CJ92_9ACTN|nr:hypothetical protein [Micromonospora phaseoli]PZV97754.1 hypothetical protein CLV64_10516 [Micromonospora phaseoli]GIJ78510.1 hypothetical protein Xph01_29420 [Micromonospora phaseoli]SEJ89556.1 hypothetical protein SAMN05443287_109238 [Micromonospora phaseoli]
MRRLLTATAVTAVLVAAAGCSGPQRQADDPAATTSTPVGATLAPVTPTPELPVATPAPGTAGGNAPEVCAAAQQASSEAGKEYVAHLGSMVSATGAGDAGGAEAAAKRAEKALSGWRQALREQSSRADDPQLKTLLTDLATEVGRLGTDIEAIGETSLDGLQQRLDQLCAR